MIRVKATFCYSLRKVCKHRRPLAFERKSQSYVQRPVRIPDFTDNTINWEVIVCELLDWSKLSGLFLLYTSHTTLGVRYYILHCQLNRWGPFRFAPHWQLKIKLLKVYCRNHTPISPTKAQVGNDWSEPRESVPI